MRKVVIAVFAAFFVCFIAISLMATSSSFSLVLQDENGNIVSSEMYTLPILVRLKVKYKYGGSYSDYFTSFPGYRSAFSSLDENLNKDLDDLYSSLYLHPKNASVTFKNGTFKYTEGECGRAMDRQAFVRDFYAGFAPQMTITLTYKKLTPSITTGMLKAQTTRLAGFSTDYSNSSEERKHNVELATKSINNKQIEPNGIFSFNSIVGSRTLENGYLNSKVIANNKFVDGVGGGVCQVSTTLYVASVLAGLQVTSVSHHSLPVGYVPPSFDAMVSDWSDLTIYNPTGAPVYIHAVADGTKISIVLYGQNSHIGYRLALRSNVIRTIPGDLYEDSNGNVYTGVPRDKTVVTSPKDGLESEAILSVYKGETLIYERCLRHDIYNPQRGIVA